MSETVGQQLQRYREGRGILAFVFEQFHVTPDPWQEEALLAFASPLSKHRRISLQACAGPGKTAVLAWCGLWFLSCLGDVDNHPKGACCSISRENLRDNLWAEYAKWINVSPYLAHALEWTGNRIASRDHPETWFLSARAWPKSANADEQGKTLSGLHGDFVMAQIDESGAVPTTVLRAGEQALSTGPKFGKLIQAGNPISLEGMLHAAANELRHLWHVIRITGDPEDPKAWIYSPRLAMRHAKGGDCHCTMCWAREQIATYGRDNPWVKSYILGEFPPASINSLLGIEDVQAAMTRHLRSDAYDWAQKRLGVDVARFGDDRTVIFPRQGLVAFKPQVLRGMRTDEIAAKVATGMIRWGAEITLVDDTGHWGHGVIDNLTGGGYNVQGVNYAGKALDPRYKNRRAEMWISMADWVKRGGALPNIPEMVAELTVPTYTFVGGQFLLEEKDQIKKRLGRSPDLGDGLATTFAIPDMPAAMLHRLKGQRNRAATADDDERVQHGVGRVERDFDPNM